MADLRLPAQLPTAAPARPMPAARAEAVRAAQRAFFETALAGEAQAAPRAPAAAETAAATPAAAPPVRDLRPPAEALAGPAPARPLRPGSLLDIRV